MDKMEPMAEGVERGGRRVALLAVVCLLVAGLAAAQVVTNRRRTSEAVEGGVSIHRVESVAVGGMRVGRALEVNAQTNAARAELLLAGEGPWVGARLDGALAQAGAIGGLALLLEAAVDEPPFLPGLYFTRGRLLGWPARGPVLVASPEGFHAFLDAAVATPDAGAGRVDLAGGDAIPVSSLNGPPVAGVATLLSGPTGGGIEQAAYFETGSVVVLLAPAQTNLDPDGALWDESRPEVERAFAPSRPTLLREARIPAGGIGVVFPPSLAGEAARLGAAASAVVTLPLGGEVALSELAAHIPGPVLEAGPDRARAEEAAIRPVDASGPEVFLAVDASGRRLFLVESGARERGRFPMGDEFLVWLGEAGAAQAAAIGPGAERLIADMRDSTLAMEAGATRARLVLAARVARPALTLPGGAELGRLRPAGVRGSSDGATRHRAAALNDGVFSRSAALEGYWAAPLPEGASLPLPGMRATAVPLQWADFAFPRPVTVHAIELLHAELAGFSPQFNLKGWRLLARNASNEPWLLLLSVTKEAPVARERCMLDEPHAARLWRLEVLEPSHVEGGEVARLAEVVFWGSE